MTTPLPTRQGQTLRNSEALETVLEAGASDPSARGAVESNLEANTLPAASFQTMGRGANPVIALRQTNIGLRHPIIALRQTNIALRHPIIGLRQTNMGLRHPIIGLRQTNIALRHPTIALRQTNMGLRHSIIGLRQTNMGSRHPIIALRQTNMGLRHPIIALRQTNMGLRHPIIRLSRTMSPVSAPLKGKALGHRTSAQLNLKLGIDSRKKAQKYQKESGWRERLVHPHVESRCVSVSSSRPSFCVFCVSLRPITFPDPESRSGLLFHPPHSQPHQPCLRR